MEAHSFGTKYFKPQGSEFRKAAGSQVSPYQDEASIRGAIKKLIRLSTNHKKVQIGEAPRDFASSIRMAEYYHFIDLFEKKAAEKKREREKLKMSAASFVSAASDELDSTHRTNRNDVEKDKDIRSLHIEYYKTLQAKALASMVQYQVLKPTVADKKFSSVGDHKTLQVGEKAKEKKDTLEVQGSISKDRLIIFKKRLCNLFLRECNDLPLASVCNDVNHDRSFSAREVETAFEQMAEENQIMIAEGIVYRI